MAGTFLLEGTGRDWSRVEALLIDRGLMVCDASALVPGRHAVCTADRTELVRVVLRGPWAGPGGSALLDLSHLRALDSRFYGPGGSSLAMSQNRPVSVGSGAYDCIYEK